VKIPILSAAAFLLMFVGRSPAQLPEGSPERTEALRDREALQTKINQTLAQGNNGDAVPLLKAALALDKKIHGETAKPVFLTLYSMAENYHTSGEHAEQAKAYAELLPLSEKLFGENHWRTKTVRVLAKRAEVLAKLNKDDKIWAAILRGENVGYRALKAGKYDEAIESWTDALLLSDSLFTKKSYHYATELQLLGMAYYRNNKFKRAIETFDELLELDLELYGEVHPDTAMNRSLLGAMYRFHGQPSKAEPHLLKSLASSRELLKDDEIDLFFTMIRGVSSFYLEQEDVERMRPFAVEAKAHAEKFFGKRSPQYCSTLLDAIDLHTRAIEFSKAILAVEEAFDVLPQVYKSPHMELARLYRYAGLLEKHQGQYEAAKASVEKALKIHGELKNRDRKGVFACRVDLGLILDECGRGDDAVALFEELLVEAKELFGEGSVRYSACLNNLAQAHRMAASLNQAEKYYARAIALKEAREKDSLDCAISIHGLGGLYLSVQDFDRAEPLLRKAAAIREQRLGDAHPLFGDSCNELAVLYLDRGDYRRSEVYAKLAVDIYAKASPRHPMTAKAMDNYAKLKDAIGDVVKAIELWQGALEIRRGILPADHFDLAVGLNNLAGGYSKLNLFEKADPLYSEAIAVLDKSKHSREVLAVSLDNHSQILERLKKYKEADEALVKAGRVWAEYEAAQPGRRPHHQKAEYLITMSLQRVRQNKPAEAITLCNEAEKLARSIYDRDNIKICLLIGAKANVLFACGKPEDARIALRQVLEMQERLLNDLIGFTSEQDLLWSVFAFRGAFSRVMYESAANPNDAALAALAWNSNARFKGIILDSLCRYREWERLLSRDRVVQAAVSEHRALKNRIANAALNPGPNDNEASLFRMRRKAGELQAEINRRISAVMPERATRFDPDRIREKLAPGSVLIEFVRTDIVDYALGDRGVQHTESYAAFVLPADPKQPLQVFDLGKADKIDRTIKLFRERLADFPPDEEARYEHLYRIPAAALHELLFKELRPALEGAETLVIIPDGELNRVPFAALVTPEKKYLIETRKLAVLPSCRDLLRPTPAAANTGVVVFANPDYNAVFADQRPKGAEPGPTLEASIAAKVPVAFSGKSWKRLPGTTAEARAIEQSLKGSRYGTIRTLEDKLATEGAVAKIESARILHFATHGTYVDYIANQKESDLRSAGSRQTVMHNPMLRSAIILAGANQPPHTGPEGDIVDGFLTALEISTLNLRGTELVVLSACQSGLGEVQASEGVLGLQRAFIYAGVQSLIVTLYEVPDRESGKLMKRFYDNLSKDPNKADALHEAQLGYLRERRGKDGTNPAHPLYWAAYVLFGDGK